jgi:hypothetical protein
MLRKGLLFLLCAAWIAGCGDAADSLPDFTKEEISANLSKGDNTPAEHICRTMGLPANCDVCEAMHWYSDGSCDTFCPKADPDCTIVQNATVILKSAAMRGYWAYVDDVLLGQDGANGDSLDGMYTLTVKGNQEHVFRVFDGHYTYSVKVYIVAGETRTLQVEPENPTSEVLLIINSKSLKNYQVFIDNELKGQEGTNGDPMDGNYTLKVKGGMAHIVRVTYGTYVYSEVITFDTVGTMNLNIELPTSPTKPSTGDAQVKVVFHGVTHYQVYVDNVLIGTEGVNGDAADTIFAFKVPGNQYHLIRVTDGLYDYTKTLYFQANDHKTIDVYKDTDLGHTGTGGGFSFGG